MSQSLFFNKVLINFIKKEALTQVFPVNFAKFLQTPFLRKTCGRLLLKSAGYVLVKTNIFAKSLYFPSKVYSQILQIDDFGKNHLFKFLLNLLSVILGLIFKELFVCSKLTMKSPERRHDVVLVSLLLTLNKFRTLFLCFYRWI